MALRNVVKDVCREVAEDPMRSNIVKMNELVDDERVKRHIEAKNRKGRQVVLGRVMKDVDYAERHTRGKYEVDL